MPINNFLILSDLDSLGGLNDLNGLSYLWSEMTCPGLTMLNKLSKFYFPDGFLLYLY